MRGNLDVTPRKDKTIVACLRWFDNVQRRPYATVTKRDSLYVMSTSRRIGIRKLGYK